MSRESELQKLNDIKEKIPDVYSSLLKRLKAKRQAKTRQFNSLQKLI